MGPFKPMYEADNYKPAVPKKRNYDMTPPPPVSEMRLTYRKGGPVKDKDGRVIGRDGNEQVIARRKSLMGSRDVQACHSSTGRMQRFIPANGRSDAKMDRPEPKGIGQHFVNRPRTKSVAKSGLRAMLGN